MKKIKIKNKGITLVALVITIILLLILAGIAIATLGGENGLFAKVKMAKKAHLEAEMKEQLTLALHDLQLEKEGNATLDDVTQEWIKKEINEYSPNLKEDASLEGKLAIMTKNNVTGKFLIDANLNIIDVEYNSDSLEFEYEVKSRNGDNIEILIKARDNVNGIKQIDYPDGRNKLVSNNKKDYIAIDYTVELGKEYKFIITTGDDNKVEKTVKIDNYYYSITKTLGDNAKIDNNEIKAAYNKEYNATVTADGDYILTELTVTMGGETITTSGSNIVDITTGKIEIEKVTGDINITATTKRLEIQYTIGVNASGSSNDISSLAENSQPKGNPLYINIIAKLEGNICTAVLKSDNSKGVPYQVTSNGKYIFKVSGTYSGKTISEDKEVIVNQYMSAQGLVQYDAGEWTEEEIEELKKDNLYMLNKEKNRNDIFNIEDSSNGLNFTFGGFTYKGDSNNESYINEGVITTNRNQSISPEKGWGTTKYSGWQILESEEKNEKTYIKKIIHAGTPENLVYNYTKEYDNRRLEYLLSGGERQTDYSKLSTGEEIKTRDWSNYKDKDMERKGYINKVYAIGYDEALLMTENENKTDGLRQTGGYYWLASAHFTGDASMMVIKKDGNIGYNYGACWGIRPVVEMNDGVYIVSGSGTEMDPYVLGKD
mgnify:FL=1